MSKYPQVDWTHVALGAGILVAAVALLLLVLASCAVITVNAGGSGEAPTVIRIEPKIDKGQNDSKQEYGTFER